MSALPKMSSLLIHLDEAVVVDGVIWQCADCY